MPAPHLLTRATLSLLACLAGLVSAPAATAAAADQRVIVGFKSEALAQRRSPAALRQHGPEAAALLGERLGLTLRDGPAISPTMQVIDVPAGMSARDLAARLRADPRVAFASIDQRRRAQAAPNDPLYPDGLVDTTPAAGQWYLRPATTGTPAGINAEGAWAHTRGVTGVVVAVLDTGILSGHPDLAGTTILSGYDFIHDTPTANDGDGRDANPADPGDWLTAADRSQSVFSDCAIEDSSWHGTKVAGLIAATTDNATGMAGVAPGVRLLPVRVLGKCGGWDSDILPAMRWAAGLTVPGVTTNPNPARIINLSLGGAGSCTNVVEGSSYQAVVDELVGLGVAVVAAAGNDGTAVGVPAGCSGVIGVGGLAHDGAKGGYSSLGPELTVSAPGGDCPDGSGACTYPLLTLTNLGTQSPGAYGYTDGYSLSIGTSFATPLATGTVALMRSINAELSPATLTSLLRGTATPFPVTDAATCVAPGGPAQTSACDCTTSTCGAGMLNAEAAVAAATNEVVTHITASTTTPSVGSTVSLDGSASVAASGRTVVGYAWAITAGADKAAFIGGTSSASAQLQVTAAGTITVQLTVTDDQGAQSSETLDLVAPAAPDVPDVSDSGGGAMGLAWGLLLALGVALLPRRGRPALRQG